MNTMNTGGSSAKRLNITTKLFLGRIDKLSFSKTVLEPNQPYGSSFSRCQSVKHKGFHSHCFILFIAFTCRF